jgi:hypothetical protein
MTLIVGCAGQMGSATKQRRSVMSDVAGSSHWCHCQIGSCWCINETLTRIISRIIAVVFRFGHALMWAHFWPCALQPMHPETLGVVLQVSR